MGIVAVAALAASAAASQRNDHRDPTANQFGRDRRQSIILAFRPAVFDRHVLALDITGFFQTLRNARRRSRDRPRRYPAEESNHRHRRLLRARAERPRVAAPPRRRDELASSHCLPRIEAQDKASAKNSTL